MPYRLLSLLILPVLAWPLAASAQRNPASAAIVPERAGLYRTREDRREAGLGTELTDWLTFSGLVESETIREVREFDHTLRDHYDWETDPAVQAAFDISLFDIAEIELIYEYTEDPHEPLLDELIIGTDVGNVGFSIGRFYVPFGIYFSHFVNGPLLEYAETRRDVFQVDYDFNDTVELAVFAFDGITRKQGQSDKDDGWGVSVDAFILNGRMNVGAGYLSNLAESDEEFLREEYGNVFLNRVGAWNAYLVYEADYWDISLEILNATGSFREFDRSENRPESWNVEAAWFPNSSVEFAVRYERSRELLEAPEQQYGIAMTWRFANNLSTTLEYLKSSYRRGFVEEDDEIFLTRGNTLAFWFAFEF